MSALAFLLFAFVAHLPSVHALDVNLMNFLYTFDIQLFNISFIPFIMWGSPQVVVPLFLLVSFTLYKKGEYKQAYLCLASLMIVVGIEFVLKNIFAIPKPAAESFISRFPIKWTVASYKAQSSFPSGHAMRTVLLSFFMISWIPEIGDRKPLKAALILIPLVTCFAAVYYGAHWASDVIAGAWLAFLAFSICDKLVSS